jgi:hypothetical protein
MLPDKNKTTPPALTGVFISTLAAMNNGDVLTDLDDALREATKASLSSMQKSKVTLELTILPKGEGVGGVPLLSVDDKIKVSLPKPPREKSSVFFADDESNLTRRNPKQEEMRLESLDGGRITKADLTAGVGQAKAAGQ